MCVQFFLADVLKKIAELWRFKGWKRSCFTLYFGISFFPIFKFSNDLENEHRKIRIILWIVLDTIHVVVLTYFHLTRAWQAYFHNATDTGGGGGGAILCPPKNSGTTGPIYKTQAAFDRSDKFIG